MLRSNPANGAVIKCVDSVSRFVESPGYCMFIDEILTARREVISEMEKKQPRKIEANDGVIWATRLQTLQECSNILLEIIERARLISAEAQSA